MDTKRRRIVISGWFSFDLPHNTAGDLLAKQSAVDWARKAGYECKIAVARPQNEDEVATETLEPSDYDAIVFVCGPLTESHILPFIQKFAGIKRIALNVSVVATSDLSKEFDVIIPRDAPDGTNPDISLATQSAPVPVIGIIYVGRQREYPTQQHEAVEKMVAAVVQKIGAAMVPIDTKLPHNEYGLSSISQVESVIKHMDLVITTRLHGSVLSLRNGVPPVVIDPVPEGAKVSRQMAELGWPLTFKAASFTEDELEAAIRTALKPETKALVAQVIARATNKLQTIETLFTESLK